LVHTQFFDACREDGFLDRVPADTRVVVAGCQFHVWVQRSVLGLLIDRLRNLVLLFDAAGLGLFAVAGTQKALAFGLDPVMAAALGMLTGIGGGMTRDVLLTEVPTVLRADLYAIAAVVVIGACGSRRLR
jgi:uncharacterized membrane protein YeiH